MPLPQFPGGNTSGVGTNQQLLPVNNPDTWRAYGHSYLQYSGGSLDQTGRPDSLFKAKMDIEPSNWRNHAKNGAILWYAGMGKGNWSTIWNTVGRGAYLNRASQPYAAEGGATLMCYGINDLGTLDPTAQIQALWKEVNRAAISRLRAGVIYKGALAGRTVFGAGFTQQTNDFDNGSSGGTYYSASAITNANITMTLPTDYLGETVSICFLGSYAGAGVVTFSGTAGVTGTLDLRSQVPSASFVYSPMVKRITNLTAGNAGQTIIATVTTFDAGTSVRFTDWWLESIAPPPVLVCGINRPTLAGYGGYGGWTGTEAEKDQDVLDANTGLKAVIAEFDKMVQYVDLDSKMAKDATMTSDGLHPNEKGGSIMVDLCSDALSKCVPPGTRGITASFNTPSLRAGIIRRPHISASWYTSEAYKGFGTSAAVVAGDQYAMPFVVSEAREVFNTWCMEAVASVTGTSVRIGCYDDVDGVGYPQKLLVGGEPTSAGAFAITTGAGVKSSSIGVPWRMDPGLFWLVVKFTVVGVSHTFRSLLGACPHMPNLTSTGLSGTLPMGYKHTGRGTTALEEYYPQTGFTMVDGIPYVGVKMV